VLEHSPAEYVRRPNVPVESPTLGLTHLQFEALLTAAKHSPNRCDFALVTMLGLLGLRILEATGSDIQDLGEEHGHRVLRVHGEGDKIKFRSDSAGDSLERLPTGPDGWCLVRGPLPQSDEPVARAAASR
ncbi:MAG: hypothetical protein M3445_11460, partial [Actinomycetota bacterium]|nr:hypothetical protein [Actinomycetota bacterium]